MPCNSDYMEPTTKEIALSRVWCLLDELEGGRLIPSEWQGYHRNVYCEKISKSEADALVRELCESLQKVDVTKYSLEMQMWWRDHQEADKKRLEKEKE